MNGLWGWLSKGGVRGGGAVGPRVGVVVKFFFYVGRAVFVVCYNSKKPVEISFKCPSSFFSSSIILGFRHYFSSRVVSFISGYDDLLQVHSGSLFKLSVSVCFNSVWRKV